MLTIANIRQFLEDFAPPSLAAEWDNVGLLVGDAAQPVKRAMTCLTVTPESVAEAVERQAELIVAHHPLPFKPLRRLTTETTPGRLLLALIRAGIAVYSPHTAFDSAADGINQQLAIGLELADIVPLLPQAMEAASPALGAGRCGRFAMPQKLGDLAARLKQFLHISGMHVVGDLNAGISIAGVGCGSGGSFLEPAIRAGCQLLVTGEATFHTCLEAQANGVALLLPGHFASERFAVERLAEILAEQFPDITVWPCQRETDPLRWI